MAARKFKEQWLALGDLRPHPRVQRQRFDEAWARKIAADFDPDQVGSLSVLRVPNRSHYWVFDGMHRQWAATEVLGSEQKVPCHVYDGLSDEQCAEITLGLNNRKSWRAIDKFAQRVIAKEPVAVDMNRIVQKLGLKIGEQPTPDTIRAVTACEWVYRKCSPSVFERTLTVLHNAWSDQWEAFDGALIKGVGIFLEKYGEEIREDHFSKRLTMHNSPVRLVGHARELSKVSRKSLPRAVTEILVREYNTKLRGSNRIAGE